MIYVYQPGSGHVRYYFTWIYTIITIIWKNRTKIETLPRPCHNNMKPNRSLTHNTSLIASTIKYILYYTFKRYRFSVSAGRFYCVMYKRIILLNYALKIHNANSHRTLRNIIIYDLRVL